MARAALRGHARQDKRIELYGICLARRIFDVIAGVVIMISVAKNASVTELGCSGVYQGVLHGNHGSTGEHLRKPRRHLMAVWLLERKRLHLPAAQRLSREGLNEKER